VNASRWTRLHRHVVARRAATERPAAIVSLLFAAAAEGTADAELGAATRALLAAEELLAEAEAAEFQAVLDQLAAERGERR